MAEPYTSEIYVKVSRVEAGQVGREVKDEMFLKFADQIHIEKLCA